MRGCLGFSVAKFVTKRRKSKWISLGLRPTLIHLDNGTSMHCWVPAGTNDDRTIISGLDSEGREFKPGLLLVHGFGAEGITTWYKQVSALAKEFRVYIPDLIFFGESTTSSSKRSEMFQAECMKKMLDKIGVERVSVIGHSYGGFVAFWMGHMYPQFVDRLIIVSSAVCMTSSTNDSILEAFGATEIKDVLLPSNAKDLRRGLELTVYKAPWLPDCVYQDMLESVGGDRKGKSELLDGLVIGSGNASPLPMLNQEVMIIWGDEDKIFNVEEAYLLQRHLGEKVARMEVLAETGHVPPLEKPNDFNRLVLEFLKH
eukprot:Gb_32048 [translate_table: standard]